MLMFNYFAWERTGRIKTFGDPGRILGVHVVGFEYLLAMNRVNWIIDEGWIDGNGIKLRRGECKVLVSCWLLPGAAGSWDSEEWGDVDYVDMWLDLSTDKKTCVWHSLVIALVPIRYGFCMGVTLISHGHHIEVTWESHGYYMGFTLVPYVGLTPGPFMNYKVDGSMRVETYGTGCVSIHGGSIV